MVHSKKLVDPAKAPEKLFKKAWTAYFPGRQGPLSNRTYESQIGTQLHNRNLPAGGVRMRLRIWDLCKVVRVKRKIDSATIPQMDTSRSPGEKLY